MISVVHFSKQFNVISVSSFLSNEYWDVLLKLMYCVAGNFHGVLIFVIFVTDIAVTKFCDSG